jgi:hypothetical protein
VVVADLGVREASDPNAESLEDLSSPLVVVSKPVVLLAVDLHGELCGVAIEVDDEALERNLPSEFRAVEPRAAPFRL